MKIAYMLINHNEPKDNKKIEDLKKYGIDYIYEEQISGKKTDRPELQAMLTYAKEGDTVYVDSFSQLARNAVDLLEIINRLSEKSIELVIIKENIDTRTSVGRLQLSLIKAIYQFERECFKERQRVGIDLAISQGRPYGRPRIEPGISFFTAYRKWKAGEITAVKAMNLSGLKKVTFYKRVKEYERVAGVFPAITQMIIALGGGDKLVATVESQKRNSGLLTVYPRLAQIQTPCSNDFKINVEDLIKLNPEIVFCMSQDQVNQVNASGLSALNVIINNYAELKQLVLLIGEILGPDNRKRAEKYNIYLEGNLTKVKVVTDKIPAVERPRVYYIWGSDVLKTCGENTLVDDWIRYSGGVNIFGHINDNGGGNATQTSLEQIIKENPDIIIIGGEHNAEAMKTIKADPAWASIAAVKNNQVYFNPAGVFVWDRLGTDSALQVLWAAKLFHPDKFQNIKIEQEVKDYYQEFYNYSLTSQEVDLMLRGHGHWPAQEKSMETITCKI